jgi:hypothetical protein
MVSFGFCAVAQSGFSALSQASECGHAEVVTLLVAAGADVNMMKEVSDL